VAVVAGLIAAVKLARVESKEIVNRSPRVRAAISDAVSIARMVIEASKIKSCLSDCKLRALDATVKAITVWPVIRRHRGARSSSPQRYARKRAWS
jgi:hypothetical protein